MTGQVQPVVVVLGCVVHGHLITFAWQNWMLFGVLSPPVKWSVSRSSSCSIFVVNWHFLSESSDEALLALSFVLLAAVAPLDRSHSAWARMIPGECIHQLEPKHRSLADEAADATEQHAESHPPGCPEEFQAAARRDCVSDDKDVMPPKLVQRNSVRAAVRSLSESNTDAADSVTRSNLSSNSTEGNSSFHDLDSPASSWASPLGRRYLGSICSGRTDEGSDHDLRYCTQRSPCTHAT